jgi:hypothetical protein
MKTILIAALLIAAPASAEVTAPAKTQIVVNQVPCYQGAECNAYHIRITRKDGTVKGDATIRSKVMLSNFSVEIPNKNGSVKVWSEK